MILRLKKWFRERCAELGMLYREATTIGGECQPEELSALLHKWRDELRAILVRYSSEEWVKTSLAGYTMNATVARLLSWQRNDIFDLKNQVAGLERQLAAFHRHVTRHDKVDPEYVLDYVTKLDSAHLEAQALNNEAVDTSHASD